MITPNEYLARERLKGLQRQEKRIKALEQELERERGINDALVEANRVGRQSLIKLNQRLVLAQELSIPLQAEIETLKDTIDCQDEDLSQLNEAREAAARADAKAEELYAANQEFSKRAAERLIKIRKLEQTIQTLENALSRQQDEKARLRGELNGANSANAKLRGTRDEIRRKLLERMRKDLLNAWPQDNYLLVSDFKDAIDRYLQEIEEGIDP